MKRISIFLLSSVAAIGCSRDNASDGKELAALKTSLDTIQTEQNKFLANQESILKAQKEILTAVKAGSRSERGAAQPRPRPPARPRPNPNSVYSVDIDGAPFKGVKNAKVTIVEAFEFA